MTKLFKDLNEGNPVFMVKYTSNIPDYYCPDHIRKLYVDKIIYGTEFEGGDLYKLKRTHVFSADEVYEIRHENSDRHDSLLLDSDFAYGNNVTNTEGYRFYTTYQGALNYLIQQIQINISKQLKRLEDIETRLGVSDRNLITIKTKSVYEQKDHWSHLKKTEIYDTCWFNDKINCNFIDNSLKDKQYEVWSKYVEHDALGRKTNHDSIYIKDKLVKKFDTLQEANAWIFKNDKSRTPCEEGTPFFEGDHYYVKEAEIK